MNPLEAYSCRIIRNGAYSGKARGVAVEPVECSAARGCRATRGRNEDMCHVTLMLGGIKLYQLFGGITAACQLQSSDSALYS